MALKFYKQTNTNKQNCPLLIANSIANKGLFELLMTYIFEVFFNLFTNHLIIKMGLTAVDQFRLRLAKKMAITSSTFIHPLRLANQESCQQTFDT